MITKLNSALSPIKSTYLTAVTLAAATLLVSCGSHPSPRATDTVTQLAPAAAPGGTQSPGDQGGGGGSTGTLSPYQQQKYDNYARVVCYNTDDHNGIGPYGFGYWLGALETDLTLSRADAIAFVKRVASKQCPENLGNISRWVNE